MARRYRRKGPLPPRMKQGLLQMIRELDHSEREPLPIEKVSLHLERDLLQMGEGSLQMEQVPLQIEILEDHL